MKAKIRLAAIVTVLTLWSCSALAQVRVLNDRAVSRILAHLQEVDFEGLPSQGPGPGDPGLPNPLTLEGVTFRERFRLESGFCTSPTCEPDPDNAQGGNISLFLNTRARISFARRPGVVVLDIQGMGDNPFVLVVTDRRGRRKSVASQGKLFGVTLFGVAAPSGIASIEVKTVGGTGGPLVLSRVLFKKNVR